jgi:hypothetical protein
MARIDPQINIRIPADLKKRLEQAGVQAGRSLTAEIVHRLKSYPDLSAALEKSEANASDDRVAAAVSLLSIASGAKVEGGALRLAAGFLRTERDRDAAQDVVNQLDAAIDKANKLRARRSSKLKRRPQEKESPR